MIMKSLFPSLPRLRRDEEAELFVQTSTAVAYLMEKTGSAIIAGSIFVNLSLGGGLAQIISFTHGLGSPLSLFHRHMSHSAVPSFSYWQN
jgi:hypothetical protein